MNSSTQFEAPTSRPHARLAVFTALLTVAGIAVAAVCPAGYPLSTPDSDFADAGNGTVRHIPTGLIWKRCSEGQSWNGSSCAGTVASYNWAGALARADAVNAGSAGTENAGRTDWRVPNLKELHSIIENACVSATINTTQFPATPDSQAYWSGTPQAGWPLYAWAVSVSYGADSWNIVTAQFGLRLVRSGGLPTQYDIAASAVAAPAITSGAPSAGTVGVPYNFTVAASGSGAITFDASGLPSGLAIDAANGAISGTPDAAGSFPITVTATNAGGTTQASYTITIAAVAVAAAPATPIPTLSQWATLALAGLLAVAAGLARRRES